MTVKEFCDGYCAAKTSAVKDALLKKLNVKDYIDVTKKRAYMELVVARANTTYDDNGNMLEKKYNSIMQHVLFTVTLVQLYTDLDIDFKREENPDSIPEVYDMLTKTGLIDKIVELIGEKEFGECMLFLGMASNDFAQNEMSLQAYVGDKINRASDLITTLLSSVNNDVIEKLNGVDMEKLKEVLKDGGSE